MQDRLNLDGAADGLEHPAPGHELGAEAEAVLGRPQLAQPNSSEHFSNDALGSVTTQDVHQLGERRVLQWKRVGGHHEREAAFSFTRAAPDGDILFIDST